MFFVWVKFVSNQIFCHKIISIIIIIINLIVITIVPLIRNEHPDEYCLSRKNHEHIYIMQIDTAKTVQNAKRLWSKRFGFLFVSFFLQRICVMSEKKMWKNVSHFDSASMFPIFFFSCTDYDSMCIWCVNSSGRYALHLPLGFFFFFCECIALHSEMVAILSVYEQNTVRLLVSPITVRLFHIHTINFSCWSYAYNFIVCCHCHCLPAFLYIYRVCVCFFLFFSFGLCAC